VLQAMRCGFGFRHLALPKQAMIKKSSERWYFDFGYFVSLVLAALALQLMRYWFDLQNLALLNLAAIPMLVTCCLFGYRPFASLGLAKIFSS
jgi:hypothetical protein